MASSARRQQAAQKITNPAAQLQADQQPEGGVHGGPPVAVAWKRRFGAGRDARVRSGTGEAEEQLFECLVFAVRRVQFAAQVAQPPVPQHLAAVHDEHRGTQVLDQRQQMRAEDDGRRRRPGSPLFPPDGGEEEGEGGMPRGGVVADQVFHGADAVRIEAGHRLVKQQGAGRVQQAAADGHLLTHACGDSSIASALRFSVSSRRWSKSSARGCQFLTR